jgi:hypothetical protein
MSGSGASNLGYGNILPFSNINGNYVNVDNSHSPATFGTNEIPGLPGLAGAKNNVDAAAGRVPGICNFKGGAKVLKRKIKNITKKYKKMRTGTKKCSSFKNRLRKRLVSRHLERKCPQGKKSKRHTYRCNKSRRHRQKGGYSQYQNNQPFNLSYSVGGILPANQLALANPPPFKVLNTAIDNYNHYTNKGFPSRGH